MNTSQPVKIPSRAGTCTLAHVCNWTETAANCPVPAANGRTAEGTNPARLLSALGEGLEPAWPVVEFMGHTLRIPFRANRCLAGAERSDRSASRSGFPRAVCSCDAWFGGTRWKVWFGAATVFR
ncbi:hypothetical protein [Streptomyces sp. NPDC059616]|uniref:hypothetical protein n=1 Tax=Streptomyces sp. NPDC059616 TaxID=3346886 RepID=UPI00369AA72D